MARAVKQQKTGETAKKRPAAARFRFGYLVHDVSRVRRTLMDQRMKPLGITRSQWSVLSTLSRVGNDGLMQVDLARLLDVGKVTVGGLVDRLESTGHVERRPDPNDRRAKRVFITDQGFEMLSKMLKVAAMFNQRILEGVSAADLEVTERTLMLVKANIKAAIVETSTVSPQIREFASASPDALRPTRRRLRAVG